MCHTRPENGSCRDTPAPGRGARTRAPRDGLLVGLMMLALVPAGEALAAEKWTMPGEALEPDLLPAPLSAAAAAIPGSHRALDLSMPPVSPTATFRPRGPSILDDTVDPFGGPAGAPLISNTTVWQRLSQYRTHDRVRVLTLWETGGSSVSLQAGRRGNPSLQWTSRSMSRGGATHGILDGVLSKSLGALLKHAGHAAPRSERPAQGGASP